MLHIIKDIFIISKSIRFKFNILALHINRDIQERYGVPTPDDKREWKYYLNLTGQKHFTNTDVQIKVLETGRVESLTKELLNQYNYTKTELLKNTSMYTELISTHPDDLEYILGCLYPVDMDVALNAVDGDILTYNPTYIESNENIIPELEIWIKNILARWCNPGFYIIEDLYPAAILGVIYSNMSGKILNIRLENIGTSRVCEYFLELFFNSNLYLWKDTKYLNKDSVFWLYRNLEYLIKHVGKKATLDSIVENVFQKNGIGIGTYRLYQTTPDANTDNTLHSLPYDKDRHVIETIPLNDSYSISSGERMTIDRLTNLQIVETDPIRGLLDTAEDQAEYIADNIRNELVQSNSNFQNTKVLDINVRELFKINPVALLDIVIHNMVHLVSENKYIGLVDFKDPNETNESGEVRLGTVVEYTEPNNSQTYALTPRTGIMMVIYMLLVLSESEDIPLTKINYKDVIDVNGNVDEIISKTFEDGYSEEAIRYTHSYLPTRPELVTTTFEMEAYIKSIVKFNKTGWVMDSNSGNDIVSANMKQYRRELEVEGELVLGDTPKTIKEHLRSEGIDYEIKSSYNVVSSLRGLLYAFTNIKVDEFEEVRLSLMSYKRILDKLTSYTTQVIDTDEGVDNKVMLYSNSQKVFLSKKGLLRVLDGETIPNEPAIGKLRTMLNDFRDEPRYFATPTYQPEVALRTNEFTKGKLLIGEDSFCRSDSPTTAVIIEKYPIYDLSGDEMVDDFYKDVDLTFNPNADKVGDLTSKGTDFTDTARMDITGNDTKGVFIKNEPLTKGIVAIDNVSGVVSDRPSNTLVVSEIVDYDITGDEMIDDLYINVDVITEPNAKQVGKVNSGGIDFIDSARIALNNEDTGTAYIKREPISNGKVYIDKESTVSEERPTTSVVMEDAEDYDISGDN